MSIDLQLKLHELMKDVLVKNGLGVDFQKAVVGTLIAGRQKKRALCILGSSNMAKSFLSKPLTKIYRTYTRPDNGSYQLETILDKEAVIQAQLEKNFFDKQSSSLKKTVEYG